MYLTHTRVHAKFTLRMVFGQVNVTEAHMRTAWQLLQQATEELPVG